MRVLFLRNSKPVAMRVEVGRAAVLESCAPDSLLQLKYAAGVGGMIPQN